MPQQTFSISENSRVEIRNCHSRVSVTGWDDTQNMLADYTARLDGNALIFENADKITLRVPRTLAVSVIDCEADVRAGDLAGRVELANIGGDVALRNLRGETIVRDVDGDLVIHDVANLQGQGIWKGDVALRGSETCAIDEIHGDASLRSVGTIKVRTIGGDLSLTGSRDGLTIDEIEGDVNVREMNGSVAINHIGGDFIASAVNASLQIADVRGDAIVSLSQAVDLKLIAKGDLILRLPDNSHAEIELDALHGDLIVRHDFRVSEQDEHHLRGIIGDGGVKIQAESTHGDLILEGDRPMRHKHVPPMGAPFARMGQEIAEEVRQSVRASLGDLPRRREIAEQVRQTVRASLSNLPVRERHQIIIQKRRHHHHDEDDAQFDEPLEQTPQKPAMTQEERQAMLDAIARGELSVDDAIKRLHGE